MYLITNINFPIYFSNMNFYDFLGIEENSPEGVSLLETIAQYWKLGACYITLCGYESEEEEEEDADD